MRAGQHRPDVVMARQAQHAASIQQPSSIYPRAARSVRGERVVCALGFSYRTRRCRSHRALSLGPPSSQGRASAGQPSIAREAWRPLPCPALPCPACSPPAGRLPHPCASRARWPWGGERVSQQNRAEGREGARVERERTEEASFRPAARLPARRKQHHLPACLRTYAREVSQSVFPHPPADRPLLTQAPARRSSRLVLSFAPPCESAEPEPEPQPEPETAPALLLHVSRTPHIPSRPTAAVVRRLLACDTIDDSSLRAGSRHHPHTHRGRASQRPATQQDSCFAVLVRAQHLPPPAPAASSLQPELAGLKQRHAEHSVRHLTFPPEPNQSRAGQQLRRVSSSLLTRPPTHPSAS